METWPTTIPLPTLDLSQAGANAMARTSIPTGKFTQRSRFKAHQRSFSVTWNLTDLEYGLFQAFILHKLHGGADAFTISLPTGGEGLKSVTVRYKEEGKYSISHTGVLYWNISATLVTDNPLVWSESVYDLLTELGNYNDLEILVARLHELVTELS